MQVNSIRNKDGHWINTNVFREEGFHFKKYGYYCPDPWGSPSWVSYWTEQLRRCKEGYEVGGVKITGHHYFYLNFCPMMRIEEVGNNKVKKLKGFPAFWDGDYNYFWASEIAFEGCSREFLDSLNLQVEIRDEFLTGGKHMIVGKARRKGYTYKNAAVAVNTYNTTRDSLCIFGAFEKKYLYPKGIMSMVSEYMDFLNENTGWRKNRDYIDRQDHRKASFKESRNGVAIEKGYKSEILALTFQDNPDAARGKDARYVFFEEAGKFPNLIPSYNATKPALESGIYTTGQIVVFGTGGDMGSGTVDFAEMFYDPATYGIMPFINIWDEDSENTNCGFFHPVFWNMDGCYDEQGNSDIEKAMTFENSIRDELLHNSKSGGRKELEARVQEYPVKPSEAFLTVSTNDFPVVELRNRLNLVLKENLHLTKCTPVILYREDGKVKAKPDLNKEKQPIYGMKPKTSDIQGCPIIKEYPLVDAPTGLYKIGYDPYQQDEGTSLAAIYVYKSNSVFSYTRNELVAWYIGRMNTADDTNRIAMMLAELYNAEIMHENMIRDVKAYFEGKKKLHLLAAQPDRVISKNIKNSRVSRIFGIHMNESLKDAGAKYIKRFLLEERDVDENGNVMTGIDTILDPGLLEELIKFNNKGNFDRVMAFMMLMFQIEEDGEKEFESKHKKDSFGVSLGEFRKKWFKKGKI